MSEEHKIIESQMKLLPLNIQSDFAQLWEYVKLAFKDVSIPMILYKLEGKRKK